MKYSILKWSIFFLSIFCLSSCFEEKDLVPPLEGLPGGGVLKIEVTQVQGNQLDFCVDLFAVNHFGQFIEKLGMECFVYESQGSGGITLQLGNLGEGVDDNKGPYSAMLLFDQSGSIANTDPDNARVEAGKGFVNVMGGGDEVAISVFTSGGAYTSPYEILSGFSDNRGDLNKIVEGLAGNEGGGTPLYISIYNLLNFTKQNSKNSNKAIVVFTDGDDTQGGVLISRLIADAKALGIEVFTIGLGDLVDQDVLAEIALGTGGAVMLAKEVSQLVSLYKSLADLLRGEGRFYNTCWNAKKASGVWRSGDIYRTELMIKLPTGETILYPITVRVP